MEGGKMAQQAPQTVAKQQHNLPKRTDLVFHLFKTGKLVSAVLQDKRVHVVRKAAYLGTLGLILLIPLVPEIAGQIITILSPLLPSEIIEIPLDGTIDWVTFAVATFSLLKFFPQDVVGEHYDRLFRR
jgi:hypothetical protein